MFWGLILEPNKRYTQTVDKPFHISQAAMDTSTGDNEVCQVMVIVEKKNYLICTLQKGKAIQLPLDLYFKTGETVSFLTNGKCNIHLTGYLDPEFEEEEDDDEEEDNEEEEEAPQLVQPGKKRQLEANNSSANKKVKLEQNKKGKPKKQQNEDDDSEDDSDVDNDLKRLLDGDISTDDNDDSFKVNTSGDADSDEDSDEEDSAVEEEEGGEEEEDDSDEEEEEEEKKVAPPPQEKLSKSQKRRLKKLQKQQEQQTKPTVNGVDKKEKPQKEEAKSPSAEKKTLSGGVAIEDLQVGSGPIAKPGKVVQVYYEGRLKQNNKKFDSCQKGAGFKFRLGSKEVISGWDVGVAGMKVGGKRKIVCPPAMAYGAKGSPPVIPPNSTLVFEVELKNVK